MDRFQYMQGITNRYGGGSRNKELQRKNQERASYEALKTQIGKRVTTTIIGSIDAAEKRFGHLWGKGKPTAECTPAELEFREIWTTLRKDILDHGNNQKRILLDELSQYRVNWDNSIKTIPIHERKI